MDNEMMEKKVLGKVNLRLIPFIVLVYLLCYIDRTNLGFAALTMNTDLGFTATVFGWGAGIFFFGYFLFEVPSNLCLKKFGARVWIARIMISWGIVASAMGLVDGTWSFLGMRFLLGATEAGFFPGIVYYLSRWYPARRRGVVLAKFTFAQPIALMIGSALSGVLLGSMNGVMGYAGWRWLFFMEGMPTVLLGIATLYYLTDSPAEAAWLEPEEREWLQDEIDAETSTVESVQKYSLKDALLSPTVIILGIVYVAICEGIYGMNIWMPQMVKAFGNYSSTTIGLIGAIPFLCAAFGILIIGWSSDHFKERKWHLVLSMAMGGLSLLASAYFSNSIVLSVGFITLCAVFLFGSIPIFWTVPSTFLVGTAAAGGIALINSIGNLGGFIGPFAVGAIKDSTGTFYSGLIFLGVTVFIGAVLAYYVCTHNEKKQAEKLGKDAKLI